MTQYFRSHLVKVERGEFHTPREFRDLPRMIRLHHAYAKDDNRYRDVIKQLFWGLGSSLNENDLDRLIDACVGKLRGESELEVQYEGLYKLHSSGDDVDALAAEA